MLPTLERACFEWRPDLILREPCEYASAVAAERLGVPHVQVAISLADVEASSLALAAPVLEPYGSRMVSQIRASPYLTRFPASLDASPFIVTRRFRELAGGSREPLPSWWGDGDEPLLYVTFGSIAGVLPIGEGAYRAALAAVAGLHTRVLLTIGRTTDRSTLGPIPANVHVEAWVPQSDVFRHATAVACHGGSGTTFGALAAGLPLVFVPLFADQSTNARRVSAGGAGLVVEFDSFRETASTIGLEDAPRIRTAIETVLADASYREAASRIALEMRGYPSVDEALATLIDRDV